MNYTEKQTIVNAINVADGSKCASIIKRTYENDVQINYSVNGDEVNISWIESRRKGCGRGTLVLREFIEEFKDKNITLNASDEDLAEWYEREGFVRTDSTATKYIPMLRPLVK